MRRHFVIGGQSWRVPLGLLLCLGLLCCKPVQAQDANDQRTFPVSLAEAKTAVQGISPTSKGRLPTLEGFVQQNDEPLERYEKGYYECAFQILPAAGGGTTIRASVKVTAWYRDPAGAKSGYRVLSSNGRLEADALDRVAENLSSHAASGLRDAAGAVAVDTQARWSQPVSSSPKGGFGAGGPSLVMPTPHVDTGKPFSLPARTNPEPAKAVSVADEKKAAELSDYIKNLEEIQRNQSRPNDLAAVKAAKTPIFAKPAESAQVLMNADAQDEFQILSVQGAWVHVQISGVSRGWMYRAQLEMPAGLSGAAGTPAAGTVGSEMFKVAKEETSPFSGDWAPLKGKPVRIEWVEPVNPAAATSRQEKLAFAKSVFLHASENLVNPAQTAEGIVVVFDSADGGQIAAALPSVKALATHTLSEAAFWRQCSVDPRDSFLEKP
jgi:hypothetical protein